MLLYCCHIMRRLRCGLVLVGLGQSYQFRSIVANSLSLFVIIADVIRDCVASFGPTFWLRSRMA